MKIRLPFKKKTAASATPPAAGAATEAPKPQYKSGETAAETLAKGMVDVKDIIAPSAIEVDFDNIKIGNYYFRTIFISGYPRFVGANWLSPIINFDHTLQTAMFYYPISSKGVLDDLRRKIGEMEATIGSDQDQGKVLDPGVVAALEDARSLQEQLVKGVERFFQFSFYITIPAETLEELNAVTRRVEATLGSLMIISKHATLQMEQGFQSTIPTCLDKLMITRNMDTTSLATTFPFTSSELSANEGVLFGINEHNGSLVIFDRFSLENANSVVFAKSGAGKSYMVKLEILRSLMFGADVIVIDPEAEYERLSEALGGDYIRFSPSSPAKINPFDLPQIISDENELGLKILSLHGLFKIIFGDMTTGQEALLDRALIATYQMKGITQDPATQNREPPVMSDLYKVLIEMRDPESTDLAEKLERYTKGSLKGIFDQPSNIKIRNKFSAFSTRDLEDILRPIAIFIILDFIWTRIKRELKKRILVVDEAWYLMQSRDSAAFMFALAKRARKYYLGLTTITQDVQDFLSNDYGRAIVTNASIQVLLKQHPASIDQLGDVFYLSEGEKRLLLASEVGEGLFFAGANHVAIRVVSSPEEHALVTTKPSELLKMKAEREQGGFSLGETNKFEEGSNPPGSPARQSQPEQPIPSGTNQPTSTDQGPSKQTGSGVAGGPLSSVPLTSPGATEGKPPPPLDAVVSDLERIRQREFGLKPEDLTNKRAQSAPPVAVANGQPTKEGGNQWPLQNNLREKIRGMQAPEEKL